MKESEPVSLIEYKRKDLLTKRGYHEQQINNINLELARLACGAESLAERQIKARLPQILPPLDHH